MKLLLIQPSQLAADGSNVKYKKLFIPFLSLSTVAALTPDGVDVKIIEDCVEDIDFDEEVDLVGLTGLTCQAPRAYQIADEFRRRGTKTIMGGIHASMCPDEACKHVDSVFIGEAEYRWPSVFEDLRNGRLKRRYEVTDKPDLNQLAIPRFDLLDFKNYVVSPFGKTPLIPIQTSRGCPHSCDFCSVTQYLGRRMRMKPVDHVIREIESICPSRVIFTDDNLMAVPSHCRELFGRLKPMGLRWVCQMSTEVRKFPELLDLAAEAGCHENFMGIETISDESLKSVRKDFNPTQEYGALFARLRSVGILPQVSLVFGLDGDTVDSLKRTLECLLSWDVNYVFLFIITPLPGTPLRRSLEKEGRILSSDWSLYDCTHPVIQFRRIETEDLVECVWETYRRFYSRRECMARAWRFRREYTKFFPRTNVFEELCFQSAIRGTVAQRHHPWSLGMEL